MSLRLVPKSVTSNDVEQRNGPYFALFSRIRVRCRHKTTTLVLKSFLIVYDHISTICAIIWAKHTLITRSGGRRR